jgi:hypothetical protein
MNYINYKATGKNKDTNRKRTLKIPARSEEIAEQLSIEQGLLPPVQIEIIPFDPPTEKQLDYAESLGIYIPENATKDDLTCLIHNSVEKDPDPNPGLIEFATNREMFFSECIGKRRLYSLVFEHLDGVDKTAFFAFSVYRWLSEDRHANLDTHPQKELFYSFADQVKNDSSFQKSLLKYKGEDLRFFGKITTEEDGYISEHYAGSDKTIAYKKTAQFIGDNFQTNLTKNENLTNHKSSNNLSKKRDKNDSSSKGNGCLLFVGLVLLFAGYAHFPTTTIVISTIILFAFMAYKFLTFCCCCNQIIEDKRNPICPKCNMKWQ